MAGFSFMLLLSISVLSLALQGYAAPASAGSAQISRRHLVWPGRLFGADRWGVVLGPAEQIALAPIPSSSPATPSTVQPAANPVNAPPPSSPTTLTVPEASTSATVQAAASESVARISSMATVAATSSHSAAVSASTDSPHFVPTTVKSTASSNAPKPALSSIPPPSHVTVANSPKPASTSSKPINSTPVTTSTKSSVAPAQSQPPLSSGSTSSADIQAYLKGHNDERAQHGASPLTWNDELASKAQQWASRCVFKHSGGTLGPFGENLAAGTGDFSIPSALGAWNAESAQYNPSDPQASHFTQVVWKATTEVGCALQTNCAGIFPSGPAQYYVCEYSPQGNVIGEIAQNVQA